MKTCKMSKLFFFFFLLFVAINLCYANGRAARVPDDCSSSLDGGLCYGNEQKFGYDVSLGRCREFVYGGCGGNDNNYPSLDACQSACEN